MTLMLLATRPTPVEVTVPSAALQCRMTMADPLPLSSTAAKSASASTATSSTPAAGPSAPVKRACDACHRRKVKCIGEGIRPCKNCSAAGLSCTYHAVPQKKGPKGSRAKVISELRETQRQTQLTTKSPEADAFALSSSFVKQSGLLTPQLITTCVDYWFANLYPTQPILYRQEVGLMRGKMETDVEAYSLIVALCAYMMIQPDMVLSPDAFEYGNMPQQSNSQIGQALLQEALRVRRAANYIENPTVWSVITSFFVFGSYFCLDKHNTAWFHLREATTLIHNMGLHEESKYQLTDNVEGSRRRRLYWLLFVTERAYAVQHHKPLTLQPTINLPTLDEDPAETAELTGFIHLANLFRPFDDTFVGFWNNAKVGCTTDWLAQLQQQLSAALPHYLNCTESQQVDLLVSQQWLRMMVWQLSISHGFLSSNAADAAMNFRFPIEVSQQLVQIGTRFSKESMEVHGIGLVEKLFDIACTLTDVMAVLPQEQTGFDFGPREYLGQLINMIGSLRGGQQRYLPVLVNKVHDALPACTSPGYSMSNCESHHSRELYEETQGYDSNPQSAAQSGQPTPMGSPLRTDFQLYGYPELVATSAMQCPQSAMTVAANAPMPLYTIPNHGMPGQEDQVKFEPSG